ncbi:triose-phosphate isomerase [Candidatus Chlorohelix allophototropha]
MQINRSSTSKRTPIIAGNWKMNKTVDEALDLVEDMMDDLDSFEGVEVVLCPPFLALFAVQTELLEDTEIKLGAQNMYWEEEGAFTGEVSPLMLREFCDYVIIGHSERRTLFGETDADVNRKVKAAFKHDITPIIAVGENLAQNEAGQAQEVVERQVRGAFEGISRQDASTAVIAYEPIWAIGTGKAANGEYANTISAHIRKILTELYDAELANVVRIQYGGSVNAKNIAEYLSQPEVDGALVGGASLKANDFVQIVATTLEVTARK